MTLAVVAAGMLLAGRAMAFDDPCAREPNRISLLQCWDKLARGSRHAAEPFAVRREMILPPGADFASSLKSFGAGEDAAAIASEAARADGGPLIDPARAYRISILFVRRPDGSSRAAHLTVREQDAEPPSWPRIVTSRSDWSWDVLHRASARLH